MSVIVEINLSIEKSVVIAASLFADKELSASSSIAFENFFQPHGMHS
jgi:hypothetical protein